MKIINLIIILGMLCSNIIAQQVVEKTAKINPGEDLALKFKFADDIIISTWDKDEVQVKVTYNINNGEDNDKFELISDDRTNGVEFESKIHDMKTISKREIIHDEDSDESVTICNHIEMDFKYEVFIPSGIHLEAETISGNYTITGFNDQMEIKTISGDLDVSLNSNTACDLELSTISGEMYTDFEIKNSNENMNHYMASNFEQKLNGGGKDIKLTTISGSIYLRKK